MEAPTLKNKQIDLLVFLTQGVGLTFFIIFLAAFYIPLPSNETLIGDPTFRFPLSIFGGIFVILTILSLVISLTTKHE